jgi:hypothetical protein
MRAHYITNIIPVNQLVSVWSRSAKSLMQQAFARFERVLDGASWSPGLTRIQASESALTEPTLALYQSDENRA